MPILRPSGSDFTALVKAAAQYVPAGAAAKASKSGGVSVAKPGLGAVVRTSQVGALASPTTSAVVINGVTPPAVAPAVVAAVVTWVNGGVVTTLAGNPFTSGGSGSADGTGTNASFNYSLGIAVLKDGNLVVTDYSAPSVRLVTYPAGVVTTLAGKSGTSGSSDGAGVNASFQTPWGVTVLSNGNIAVADRAGSIRIITYPGGVVSTLVTGLNGPRGIATLADGNLVVCAANDHSILRVTYPGGVVTTLAGQTSSGYADGVGTSAQFSSPTAITVLPNGNIAVADHINARIRLITYPGGVVTTLAGNGTFTSVDGVGTNATFNGPYGISATPDGKLVVVDSGGSRIRVVTSAGAVTTLAGNGSHSSVNGTGTGASFTYPNNICVLPDSKLAVLDGNNSIRLIT